MQSSRRTSALPLPQSELDRLKATLSPNYGGQVWEGGGARILVVCVPRPEPDLVNDIEAAVEYLGPADTQDLTAALLVGSERTPAAPVPCSAAGPAGSSPAPAGPRAPSAPLLVGWERTHAVPVQPFVDLMARR